jgi:hypothetical protein
MIIISYSMTILSRLILAVVLGLSGFLKLRNIDYTLKTIINYGINNRTISKILSLILPIVEIASSVLLVLLGRSMILTFFVSLLFAIFFIAIIVNLRTGKLIPCGCFGEHYKQNISWRTAIRTGAFLGASLSIALNSNQSLIQNVSNIGSTILSFGGLILSIIGLLLIIEPKHKGTQLNNKDVNISTKLNHNRREALKIFGAAIIALFTLFIPQFKVEASCCYCQYYDHFDLVVVFNIYRLRHYFKRCCNPCLNTYGQWRKYQPDFCPSECTCIPNEACDYMYSCTLETCYPSECCQS